MKRISPYIKRWPRSSRAGPWIVSVLCLHLAVVPACLAEGTLDASLEKLTSGRAKVSFSVRDKSGREIASGGLSPLKPASVLKTITSAAVLQTLGLAHKFKTEVYLKGRRGDNAEELIVKGGGDPSLTIEGLFVLARKVKTLGIRRVSKVLVDDSSFAGSRGSSGARAFEAGSSALSLNFNSVTVSVCPGQRGSKGEVELDPWESRIKVINRTTTSGQNKGLDAGWVDGGLQVSGEIGAGQPCEYLYRSVPDPVEYFGETLVGLLEEVGVQVPRKFEVRRVSPGAILIYTHESKPLVQILQDLNWYSNNFIAQQLVFALGPGDGSFSEDIGLSVLRRYARELGEGEAVILDGAGLNHGNRVTSSLITKVIYGAANDPASGPDYLSTLSRPGIGGTLKRRNFGNASPFLRGKTGSLDGVSSLAGVVTSAKGAPLYFAILQNEVDGRGAAQELEERFVKALYQYSIDQ